ncbi:MAG: MFS transporter [Candidatus Sumerlaeaceae bacterium]
MSSATATSQTAGGINPDRLFLASCIALIATAVSFAVIGDIMGALKSHFGLNNRDVGFIAGAGTWGFTLSIFALGPLCDALGMRRLVWFAFICHLAGAVTMIFAQGFWSLFFGALILSMGNGTVEAVCNPLVATIYPDRKTEKLNQFHVWFPGGIVIGGLACFLLSKIGMGWQPKLGLVVLPTLVYGALFIGQSVPATERVQSGVSFADMCRSTFLRPLFLVLLFCMMITASLELGPNRWIPSILQAGGIHGILVLVWISGIMAVLRFFAGPIVHRLSPTGLLTVSAVLTGLGLIWLSYAETVQMAFAAATVFALGVCYFWPTMLGVVSERVPRGGSLALALMGGIGMLAVGMITTPWMGSIADKHLATKLPVEQTLSVLTRIKGELAGAEVKATAKQSADIHGALDAIQSAVAKTPPGSTTVAQPETANALRTSLKTDLDTPAIKEGKALLDPADNYGGRMSFRFLAPFAAILVVIFGFLYARDRAAGGYRAESIHSRATDT